jgi:protein TonB
MRKETIMSTDTAAISRSGAFFGVAALHAILIYGIGVSLGVLEVPLAHESQASFIADDKPNVHEAPVIPTANTQFSPDPLKQPAVPRLIIDDEPPQLVGPTPTDPSTAGGSTNERLLEPEPIVSATPLITDEPHYPAAAIRNNEQGVVVLRVLVGSDGRVLDAAVAQSSGHPRLDDAALKSVRSWKFKPASQAGTAVASWLSLPIRFQLRS